MPAGIAAISQDQLLLAVQQQIEYYFSIQNLVKDVFLRSKMNEEGWIPLHVIASFNRVRMLTPDLAMIMEALSDSSSVELSPDSLLIRPKQGHQQWVLPAAQRDASAHAAPHMPGTSNSNGSSTAQQSNQSQEAPSNASIPAAAVSDNAADIAKTSIDSEGSGSQGRTAAQTGDAQPSDAGTASAAPASTSSSRELEAQSSRHAGKAVDQQHAAGTAEAEEEHAEDDADILFEMDEVCCRLSYRWLHIIASCTSLPLVLC